MEIRRAAAADRAGLYEVCLRTANAGDDGSHLFTDPELVGHNFVGPYIEYAGATVHVIAEGGRVLGYSIGVPDTRAFDEYFVAEWSTPLREAYPLTMLDDASLTDDDRWMIRRLHDGPADVGELLIAYPGHAHIDLLPEAQGAGFGRVLMERAMQAIAAGGAHGMHLDVSPRNVRARGFYAHLGFAEGPTLEGVSYLVRSLAEPLPGEEPGSYGAGG